MEHLYAHFVRDCGPLWATATFTFEAHSHVLISMFHGTQYVLQQIADAFLLKTKIAFSARGCVDSCAPVKEVLSKLTDDTKRKNQDGLTPLGSEKSVTLSAHCTIVL